VAHSSRSLLGRVAWGAAISAAIAALLAASVTSVLAAYLTRRAHDRRLMDAAFVLKVELEEGHHGEFSVPLIVADEQRETMHTGLAFGVFETQPESRLLAGDPRVPTLLTAMCTDAESLRACAVPARASLWVVAADVPEDVTGLLMLSSALAALLAGLGAWLASRPIARWLMGPLSLLRQEVGAIDFASTRSLGLGPAAGVAEVDALRNAIAELLARVASALRQAERFAADAAHELRTPLTTIRGELELLSEDSSIRPDVHASLARAGRRTLELQTLLERLLVLALPDESGWSASELVSLQELAEDMIALIPEAERARITLQEPVGDVLVRGDTTLLNLLFSNGLGNALKFGQRVSVSAYADPPDVVLRVDDDGPGVPPEKRELVFEPFVRLRAAGEPPVVGHGLGLALIAHVARRHGGIARFVDDAPGAHLETRLPKASDTHQPSPARPSTSRVREERRKRS
jgi:two-component system OmpR family sensor kinase